MTVILEKGEWPSVEIGDRVQYKPFVGPAINGVLEDIDYNEGVLSYFIRKANNQLEYCDVLSIRRMRKKNRKKYTKNQKALRRQHLEDLIIVKG